MNGFDLPIFENPRQPNYNIRHIYIDGVRVNRYGDIMSNDELFTKAEPDRFQTESPTRGFATFEVNGNVAIGKGFRPSMQHLGAYLGAMLNKEGWGLIQVLDAPGRDPTMIFRRTPSELTPDVKQKPDMVNHPPHYNNHPSGLECIAIKRHMPSNIGDAFKYVWRAGEKGPAKVDYGKALWYVNDEIERRKTMAPMIAPAGDGSYFRQAMLVDGVGNKFVRWTNAYSGQRADRCEKYALHYLYMACTHTSHLQETLLNAKYNLEVLLNMDRDDD